MRTRLLFMVVGLIIFYGWTTRQINGIKKAAWLIGTWENLPTEQAGKTPRGTIYETWTKTSDDESHFYLLFRNLVFRKWPMPR